jgi:hypothetical protein
MKNKSYFLFLLLALLAFDVACTRKQEEAKKITLKLPQSIRAPQSKVGSSSTIAVRHIVINVHNGPKGGGIKSYWAWDACHGPCDAAHMATPPETIVLDVPKGGQSLVQIVGAGDDGTGSMAFLYDDEVVDLGKTVVFVSLFKRVLYLTVSLQPSILMVDSLNTSFQKRVFLRLETRHFI